MALRDVRKKVYARRINLRLVRRESLPMAGGDPERLRSILESVDRFCGRNLSDGEVLAIEAGPKKIGEDRYAEVQITPFFAESIEFDERKKNRPFLEVGKRIELGRALASDILRRYQGHFEQIHQEQFRLW